MVQERSRILAVNVGSSSLKFAVFGAAEPLTRQWVGKIERIGLANATWTAGRADGVSESRPAAAPDHATAVALLIDWLDRTLGTNALAIVGHRVVHGGERFRRPERITPEVVAELKRISPLDPNHMPSGIAVIEAFQRSQPGLSQAACFDTAFHHDLPRHARLLPLPRRFEALGVRRYGFHGLSYAYLMEELERIAGASEARGRVLLAHLGAGASLAAVRDGRCIDTTMSFTPAAGLMMATRTGDFDPGLVQFLTRAEGLTPEQFDRLVNHESGLLGVSETSSDVRELLVRENDDVRAAEALTMFCYQVKKWIGAYAAALGGLDALVFAGGIGEHAPEIRRRICDGLRFLGVVLDEGRNAVGQGLISPDDASVKVRVVPTDEELMIARAVLRLIHNE